MGAKVNYTLVGLFVIALVAAIGLIVAWLTAATDTRVYDRYRVYMTESVAGLVLNAPVKYKGVDVGKVVTIRLDKDNPDQVELVLSIERGTPILQDTIATLKIQGLTGLAYVELSGGGPQSPPLTPPVEGELPVIKAGPSLLARLDTAFDLALAQFSHLSARLDTLLSDRNQAAVSRALENLGVITGAVAGRSDSIDRTLTNRGTVTAAVAARADRISKSLDYVAQTTKNSVQVSAELASLLQRGAQAVAVLEETARTFAQTGRTIDQAVRQSSEDVNRVAGDTTALIARLRRLTDDLDRLSRELERNPNMLLFGKQPGRRGPGE